METNIFSHAPGAKHVYAAILTAILCAISLQTSAQGQQGLAIKGTVVFSEDSEAAPGVNVYLKGSTGQGIYTDENGIFQLPELLHPGDVLVFSFVGRETVERTILRGDDALHVVMYPDPIQMVEEPLVFTDQSRKPLIARIFRRINR